jgi:hypothetical protein
VLASFRPEELELCAFILDLACTRMQTRDEITRELMGVRILDAAESGERNPDILLQHALAA